MAAIKTTFGPATAVTTTSLGGLANNGQYTMAAVDNSSDLYLDALVMLWAMTNATTAPTGSPYVAAYVYGSSDGTTFPDNVSGAESTTALDNLANVKLLGVLTMRTAISALDKAGPFSVAAAFGGTLPAKWGVILVNSSGQALAAGNSASTNGLTWTGVYATSS